MENKTKKKNQGSPIKTIKSHDYILVPLLSWGVYSPPGLHRPCHSLHICTSVWGAQDHDTGNICMLHSNTNKTLYSPLSTMPEYSMPCQRKSKRQKQNKSVAHNSTPHLGRVQWKRGNIIFSPVHIFLHVLPSPSCSPPPQLCPQFVQ